ncbi:MAG: cytochrome P450 [Gammaproteobacteria bacterium]|nr:cytochrome P450 [Gammaproteobacteria bacterium]
MDPQQVYSARMGYDAPLGDFFAGGLLVRDFADHKFHRRIMQTAFKTSSMKHYIHSVNELAEGAIRGWHRDADFHFYPHIKTLLLEIGARVFVGVGLDGDIERLNQAFLDMMAGTLAIVRKDWPGLRYRKGLLAAHDTTTSALTMASYYLARHPQWQERLRAEVDALDRNLGYEDVGANVPLLEQAFHEILRLHPPVPQMMRRTIRATELGGYPIVAHTMVAISPIYCHRMAEYWKEPHTFDPDRFGPEREEHKQHPYLWVPFGGGAHKCIGLHFADMLFKCVMSQMLRNYSFRLPDAYPEPPSIMHFPFAKLTDDLPLRLEPRRRG